MYINTYTCIYTCTAESLSYTPHTNILAYINYTSVKKAEYTGHDFAVSVSIQGFLGGAVVKNSSAMQEMQVQSLGREEPPDRKWQSTPVFLPGESHGHRSLAGYIRGVRRSVT